MAGDKYARAKALSKIFEELLTRNSGSKEAAKEDMDSKLGKDWQLEIVIDDEVGPEFIDESLIDDEIDSSPDSMDEMMKKAREFTKDFIGHDKDLEYDPKEAGTDPRKSEGSRDKTCISALLRELADKLEAKK